MNDEDITNLLAQNKLKEAMEAIETSDEYVKYAYSPLNKSPETQLFEKITCDIIDDTVNQGTAGFIRKIRFEKDEKDNIFIKHNGESINLADLLDKVNFTHISIPKEYIEKYATVPWGTFSHEGFLEKI